MSDDKVINEELVQNLDMLDIVQKWGYLKHLMDTMG